MKLDIWKVSTLVFGGALVLLVGSGGIQETAACDMEEVSRPPDRTAVFLRAAASSLGRADSQLRAVNVDRGGHRAKALGHLALALDEVDRAVALAERPMPRPKPRPMKRAAGDTRAKVVLNDTK